jgi:Cation transporter/ATPase, N-terminus
MSASDRLEKVEMSRDTFSFASVRGLSEADAQARPETEGYNELPRSDRRTPLRIIIEVVREPINAARKLRSQRQDEWLLKPENAAPFTGPPMDLDNIRSLGVTKVDVYSKLKSGRAARL